MDWTQVLIQSAVLVVNIATAISMYMYLEKKNSEQINYVREDNKAFQKAMLNESREFHARICKIEEKSKCQKQPTSEKK